MGMPSMPELIIILAIVVLLFGAKKIPDLAKGIGSGIKNFKKAVKDEDDKREDEVQVAQSEKISTQKDEQKETPKETQSAQDSSQNTKNA